MQTRNDTERLTTVAKAHPEYHLVRGINLFGLMVVVFYKLDKTGYEIVDWFITTENGIATKGWLNLSQNIVDELEHQIFDDALKRGLRGCSARGGEL